jgi:hypothetical protein
VTCELYPGMLVNAFFSPEVDDGSSLTTLLCVLQLAD